MPPSPTYWVLVVSIGVSVIAQGVARWLGGAWLWELWDEQRAYQLTGAQLWTQVACQGATMVVCAVGFVVWWIYR